MGDFLEVSPEKIESSLAELMANFREESTISNKVHLASAMVSLSMAGQAGQGCHLTAEGTRLVAILATIGLGFDLLEKAKNQQNKPKT